MSQIELSLVTTKQIHSILQHVNTWGIDARIVSKAGDIYDTYISSNDIPATCVVSMLPPTKEEMLLRDEWTIPSGHLKVYIGKEYLNRYGQIRRKDVYIFLNELIRFNKLQVFDDIIYINKHLQELLQTHCGSMTFVEIYQKVDENLIAV